MKIQKNVVGDLCPNWLINDEELPDDGFKMDNELVGCLTESHEPQHGVFSPCTTISMLIYLFE